MIGIYNDSFIDYLRKNLRVEPKITSTNIITRCPFCWDDHQKRGKDHRHLYISLEVPIFNCFQSGCPAKGTISKLIKSLEGSDYSHKFVNEDKLEEYKKKKVEETRQRPEKKELYFPKIDVDRFPGKEFYLRKRLKFSNIINIHNIDGLVFDVDTFLQKNNVEIDFKLSKMKDFLHRNFIGFATRNRNYVIFRNIDDKSQFRYYKLRLYNSNMMDYYCIKFNHTHKSNVVILAEGIFDIFGEYIFDSIGYRQDCRVYASAQSDKFQSVLKSVIFDEQIFKPDVKILSDNNMDLNFYKKIKKFNSHILNTITVYYNKCGKDFGDGPVPTKFSI